MSNATISIDTDVATLVLFHPDDLDHRKDDPIGWYCYDSIYPEEAAAGRLVAFGTGADGTFTVRLTTGDLTPRETAYACRSWVFPFVVRHGRLLVDNTDALPGEEQITDPATEADCWYEIADGSYRVTVHPLEWNAEPGATDEKGDATANALPDYVITFEAVDDIKSIAVSATPPDLRRSRTWEPILLPSMDEEDDEEEDEEEARD